MLAAVVLLLSLILYFIYRSFVSKESGIHVVGKPQSGRSDWNMHFKNIYSYDSQTA